MKIFGLWMLAAALMCFGAAAQQRAPSVDANRNRTVNTPALQVQSRAVQAPLLTPAQIKSVALAAEPPKGATPKDLGDMDRIVTLLQQGKQDEANSLWVRVAQRQAEKGKGHDKWINIDSFSSYILNRAYLQPDADLKLRAEKVRAAHVRHEATHVTQQAAPPSRVQDDAQLANVDLQNALQKQQQILQTMSNILKKMSDTAQSITQNMK